MNTSARGWWKTGAIGLAGLAAGGILATTVSATAEDAADGSRNGAGAGQADPAQRGAEEPLTGETADQVREAALAEYPGATVLRLETDSDGVYEAHLVKADGTPVTVEIGKDFTVTGEEEGGFGHGFGHGFGDLGGGAPGSPGAGSSDDTTQNSSTV